MRKVALAILVAGMLAYARAWSPVTVNCESGEDSTWCAEKQNALDFHNYARQEVDTPYQVWWSYLEAQAREYAIQLAKNDCKLVHSPSSSRPNQGENLAMMGGGGMPLGQASKMWYDEKSLFNPSWKVGDGTFSQYGHYTQMIWRNTRYVGCSRSGQVKTSTGGVCEVSVCRYYPGGNYIGLSPY